MSRLLLTLILILILLCLIAVDLSSQQYKFFSRPGGDLFDLVQASCIQNDTVYAVVQSGDGVPSMSTLQKLSLIHI